MTPACPAYVKRQLPDVIDMIQREPGREYAVVRRSKDWNGWDALLYRGQGLDADPVKVGEAKDYPTPEEAFAEAVRQMRTEVAA